MILGWKSKLWSVFSIWGPFLGVWEAILSYFGLFLSNLSKNRGISEKNENFHFFPVRVWGWVRWVALVKILIFMRFWAHYIIWLLFKKGIFWIFQKKIWFSQKCKSRCSRTSEMEIFGFHTIVHFLWQLLKDQSCWHWPLRTLKISKNHFVDFQWCKIWPIQDPICTLKLNVANFMQCQGA